MGQHPFSISVFTALSLAGCMISSSDVAELSTDQDVQVYQARVVEHCVIARAEAVERPLTEREQRLILTCSEAVKWDSCLLASGHFGDDRVDELLGWHTDCTPRGPHPGSKPRS